MFVHIAGDTVTSLEASSTQDPHARRISVPADLGPDWSPALLPAGPRPRLALGPPPRAHPLAAPPLAPPRPAPRPSSLRLGVSEFSLRSGRTLGRAAAGPAEAARGPGPDF